jgi:hypothetical protein
MEASLKSKIDPVFPDSPFCSCHSIGKFLEMWQRWYLDSRTVSVMTVDVIITIVAIVWIDIELRQIVSVVSQDENNHEYSFCTGFGRWQCGFSGSFGPQNPGTRPFGHPHPLS